MKGSVTDRTSIYHTRLPHQWDLERMSADILSRDAQKRLRWVDHYIRRGNARLTCRYYGISPTTFHKWYRRFLEEGLPGLENRSRAPLRRRRPTVTREQASLVVLIRRENPSWSKYKISHVLRRDHRVGLSASTVGRILKRKGLYDKRKSLKRKRAARKRARRLRAERWMRDLFPGALVQVDTKHLRYGDHRYYQFTAVDTFSRLGFIHVSSGISSRAGAEFLTLLREYLPFDVKAVQTDNGSEYAKDFERALEREAIEHYFTYPNCPKQNARVERMIQTSRDELWNFREGYSVKELNEIAGEWVESYNGYRPHQSLGYKTPAEFLRAWYGMSKDREHVSTM